MSIHLDPFLPEVTNHGVGFFADVNGRRVRCLVETNVLKSLETGPASASQNGDLFKKNWSKIQKAVYQKIQQNNFESNGEIVLREADFDSYVPASSPNLPMTDLPTI